MALNLAPFGRWTQRDKAAQRRLAPRQAAWAMFKAGLLATLTFVVSAPLTAAILFFPVMLLAGPHSSILPSFVQPVILLMGWLAVLAIPGWLAVRVYRRVKSSHAHIRHTA